MENYFNYFTEIEEHFQKRRGAARLLSTLDWALIETWKDAGIPLEAVLRGIDAAFDTFERRPSRSRQVNSLAYCAQEVLASAEEMKEAAVGVARPQGKRETGFEPQAVAAYLEKNAVTLERAELPESLRQAVAEAARSLRALRTSLLDARAARLEEIEQRLSMMEEKLFAVLVASASDEELLRARSDAERDVAPYRSKVPAAQMSQLHKQYVQKRLLESYRLPRLSLFYM